MAETQDPITPRSPEPELPIRGEFMVFDKRMKDFVWGTGTGDMTSKEGYRIYKSWYRDTWQVEFDGRRFGETEDLRVAIKRAEFSYIRRIERGEVVFPETA